MKVDSYALILDGLAVEAEIGIHDFERGRRQRVGVRVELELDPGAVPAGDDIAAALDYDWLRLGILELARTRRFELQETLARAILQIAFAKPQVRGVLVETAKLDVYPDARSVGCRIRASR